MPSSPRPRPPVTPRRLPAGSGSNPGSVNGIPNLPTVQDRSIGTSAAINDANRMGIVHQPLFPVGMTPTAPTRNVISPSGGARRTGGGGGGGVQPDLTGAYQSYLEFMKSQNGDFLRDPALLAALGDTSGLEARVGRYEQAARGAHDAGVGAINDAASKGNARLDQIVNMLSQRLAGARGDVEGVFRGNAAELANLGAQAQGRADEVAQGVGRSAAGFGFEPAGGVQGVQDLAAAIQAAQSAKASGYSAAYADRQNVYGGLQADVSGNILDRQGALSGQAAQALQQLLGDAGVRRTEGLAQIQQQQLMEQARQSQAAAQFNQGNQQSIYQLMLEAAQQGVKL
jgi:hypothetical protein